MLTRGLWIPLLSMAKLLAAGSGRDYSLFCCVNGLTCMTTSFLFNLLMVGAKQQWEPRSENKVPLLWMVSVCFLVSQVCHQVS